MDTINLLGILAKFTFYLPLFIVIITFPVARWGYKRLDSERLLGMVTFISSFFLLLVSIGMLFTEQREADFNFLSWINFRVDSLSIFMILLVNIVAFAASWNSLAYLAGTPSSPKKEWWRQKTGFHWLINLFHFTMLLVPLANNLVVAWIAIELTTVGSAILIVYEGRKFRMNVKTLENGHELTKNHGQIIPNGGTFIENLMRPRKSSWEATWKYLIITSTGIVLALLGTIFLASHTDLNPNTPNQLLDWSFLIKNSSDLKPQMVWFAFLFALVGYGTKAGLAPLHTWLPDGHGEAPAPISALLSGVLLKASFYVILRFYILTNAVLQKTHPDWTSYALLIAGLLSLLIATPFILKKNPFKRVLAYHSLEHMGIIAFGFGIGGPIAIAGALLHMLNHAITKALMFLAYGNISRKYEKEGILITGVLRSMPWSGSMLTLGGLALVGTPPFNIFMSELIILWGALSRFIPDQAPAPPAYPKPIAGIAIAVFIISTTLIFYGLVNHLKKIVLGKAEKENLREQFSWHAIVPILFLFALMLLFGTWIVPPLANLVSESVGIVLQK